MYKARSGNSSRDEIPTPGDYRTGYPEGGGIMLEVSWTSDTRVGGVSGLVDLFRTTFVFGIHSSGCFYSTGQIIGQTAREGVSMFVVLGGVANEQMVYSYCTYFFDQF